MLVKILPALCQTQLVQGEHSYWAPSVHTEAGCLGKNVLGGSHPSVVPSMFRHVTLWEIAAVHCGAAALMRQLMPLRKLWVSGIQC